MSKAQMTVTVPDGGALDAVGVLMQMTEEFFYANRESLGDEALDAINVKIEILEENTK